MGFGGAFLIAQCIVSGCSLQHKRLCSLISVPLCSVREIRKAEFHHMTQQDRETPSNVSKFNWLSRQDVGYKTSAEHHAYG
jgi:hypothetical protein